MESIKLLSNHRFASSASFSVLKPTKPNLLEVPSGLYAILTSVRVEYFKDEEEVDAVFFEAWPVKCFRNASGVKYGGRFLIIRRDMADFVPRLGVAVRVRGRRNRKKKLWEKAPEEGRMIDACR